MDTPAPIDTNRLKSILMNAKKVMVATDEKFPSKKNNNSVSETYEPEVQSRQTSRKQPQAPMYDEHDEREPEYSAPDLSQFSTEVRDYTAEDVMRSNLPPAIKEAMLNKPIARLSGPPSKFSLDGLEDLIDKPINKTGQKQPIREARQTSDLISISRTELNEMIDKRVSEVLAQMFAKTISEQSIKKTINMLINEGKITVKKKS